MGEGAKRVVLAALSGMLLCSSTAHADPESPWGVAPSAALSYDPAGWASPMARAGVTWVRGFHIAGGAESVKPLKAAGFSLCGFLMWSPTSPPTFPVESLEEFRRYVVEQVKKYRGVVTHWEVWNEPPNFSEDKSPGSYARIVATAYDAAKSVDPNIKIGIAAKSVHAQFIAESIRHGAKDKFDFVTLHPYETASMLRDGWEGPFLGIVSNVRAMLRAVNPKKADVPIWFTEIGMEATPEAPRPISEALQADSLIKIYTLAIAQGVARIHWFDPKDSEGYSYGLLRADGTPRPAYHALRELTRALGVRPKFQGHVSLAPNTYGFLFAGATHDVLVAWSKPELCQAVQFPDPVAVIDPDRASHETCETANLTAEPLIFSAAHGSKTAKAWRAARKAERPAWDSGSEAGSVTLRAGSPPLGIHVAGVIEQRCQDGRCELDLSQHTGAQFAVDPLFLGYSGQPIEVVLTLQPHNSRRAGFNLKYEVAGVESDDFGMTSTGHWNFVAGEAPITLRWKISKPSFVGKYGASLSVDCDSMEQCDFGITSIIVNKH